MTLQTIRFAALLGALSAGLIACGGASSAPASQSAPAAADTEHQIVIHRGVTAGQRFRVEVEAHQLVKAVESVENPEEMIIEDFTEDTQVAFVATVLIVEADEAGRASRAEVTVDSFTDPVSGEEVLPAGTELIMGWQGEALHIEANGAELGEDAMERLELAFPLERPGSALGDELFGTPTPRAVGATWDLHKANVVEDLADDGYTITETNLNGQTRFTGLTSCGDTECMVLEAALAAEQVVLAEEWQMADFEAGEFQALVRLTLPTDTSRPIYSEEAALRGAFVVELREGDELTQVLASISRMRTATYTEIVAD